MHLSKKPVLYLLLFVLVSFSGKVKADDFKFIPSIDVKGEYNDNIFFDNNNEEEDFITTVSPLLKLGNKTERLITDLSARFNGIIYSDNNDLNAIDQNFKGRIKYQFTTGSDISADAGYKKDSRRDRDIEVADQTEATGLVQKDSTRISRICGFSSSIILNEISALNCSYSFAKDDFEDREDNDIRMQNVTLGFTRHLNFIDELTVGRLTFGYGRYDYLDSEIVRHLNMGIVQHYIDNSKIDSYSVTIGVSRNISEVFTILADIGGRHTRSKYKTRIEYDPWIIPLNNITQQEDNSSNGIVAQVVGSYNGEITGGGFSFYHDVRPSSGRSGATERTSIKFDIKRRFTYKLSGSFSTEYYLNKADKGEFASRGIDEKTWRVRPGIKYDFTHDFFIEASYDFLKVKDSEDHTNQKRNQFLIKISMDYPLFE